MTDVDSVILLKDEGEMVMTTVYFHAGSIQRLALTTRSRSSNAGDPGCAKCRPKKRDLWYSYGVNNLRLGFGFFLCIGLIRGNRGVPVAGRLLAKHCQVSAQFSDFLESLARFGLHRVPPRGTCVCFAQGAAFGLQHRNQGF